MRSRRAFYRENPRASLGQCATLLSVTEFALDSDEFVLLLSDFAPCSQGDQLVGCSVDDARRAVAEIAGLHAPLWGNFELKQMPWLHRNPPDKKRNVEALFAQLAPGFLERYRGRLNPAAIEVCEHLARSPRDYFTYDPVRFTVVHGDFRLDNVLFVDGADRRIGVVDFQTVAVGCHSWTSRISSVLV